MKKLLVIGIVFIMALNLLAGCAENGDSEVVDVSKVVFCDPYGGGDKDNGYYGIIDYSGLERSSGLKISAVNFLDDQQRLKLLAGDTDADIYIISPDLARLLKEKGIYSLIESEKIKQFNSGCFDYLNDYTMTDSGETYLMPVFLNVCEIAYPKSAAEEAGFDNSNLLYYDDMMDIVKNYPGERIAFSSNTSFFSHMELQYEHFSVTSPMGNLII